MGCGTPGGCSGGSGTSGNGRTPYTPAKSGSNPWSGSRKISGGGATTTVGRASEFGTPKVRLNFSSRAKK